MVKPCTQVSKGTRQWLVHVHGLALGEAICFSTLSAVLLNHHCICDAGMRSMQGAGGVAKPHGLGVFNGLHVYVFAGRMSLLL